MAKVRPSPFRHFQRGALKSKQEMFEFSHSKKQKGFTLIELLVVISIIGTLSGMVMVAMQDMRAAARDARRRQDLAQIAKAVELYNLDNEHYKIDNSGWTDAATGVSCGCGWFSYEGGVNYPRSIARALVEDGGKVATIIKDPTGGTSCSTTAGYAYMLYLRGNGFYVYAKLEKPAAADLATCDANAQCPTSYGMNYAVGHR